MQTTTKRVLAVVLALGLFFAATACQSGSKRNQAIRDDQNKTAEGAVALQASQPTHTYTYSQLKQNVQDIEDAQANPTQTTAFFFNQGVPNPVDTCPSIGFPIPATDQLTNPEQKVPDHDLTLPQQDPTGVYTGDTSGTYVICIDANGKGYANYWEGFVKVVSGPAEWDAAKGQIVLTGDVTGDFSTEQK